VLGGDWCWVVTGDGCGREYSSGSSKLRLWTNSVAAGNLLPGGPADGKSLPRRVPRRIRYRPYSSFWDPKSVHLVSHPIFFL
jgi:hypothetical protein